MEYLTVNNGGEAEVVRSKSRFLAVCAHASDEAGALAFVESVKKRHPAARHNVYAYRLRENNLTRYTDDGEPAGTAGLPVLGVLSGRELTDAVLVVTRYFGGTLLGKGGLVSAYSDAAKQAVESAGVVCMALCRRLSVTVAYPFYERVLQAVEAAGATAEPAEFLQLVRLPFSVRDENAAALITSISDITRGGAEFSPGETLYLPSK